MSLAIALVAIPAGAAVLGLAMTGSRARRFALLALSSVTLAAPFAMSGVPLLVRGAMSLPIAWAYLRLVELALERRAVPPLRRALHAAVMVEMRFTRRAPPRLHGRALVRLLAMGAIAAIALTTLLRVAPTDRALELLRSFAALVASYTAFDAGCALAMVLWTALGFELPRLHDDPIKSRTVAEFWGERWNRIVGSWLRAHCFMPLARRRRPRLGIVAAFGASTVLHVYLAAIFGARAALMWGLFFGLQIPIVLAERALRVAAWRPAAGRIWTIGVFAAVSPLFVDPVLRAFDALR